MKIYLNYMELETEEHTTIADLMRRFHIRNLYALRNDLPVRGDEYDIELQEGDSVKFIRTIIL